MNCLEARCILTFRERLSEDLSGNVLILERSELHRKTVRQEDQELLKRAKLDHEGFGMLYEKYRSRVFHYFLYRTGHEIEIAEDLTQETFMRAFKALDRFEYQACNYLTYLTTIAHNLLINHYRTNQTVSLESMHYLPQEAIVDHEKESKKNVDLTVVWEFVNHLSQLEKRVLTMKYRQDHSIKIIAAQLSKSPNAIKIILSRARKKLKRKCSACVTKI